MEIKSNLIGELLISSLDRAASGRGGREIAQLPGKTQLIPKPRSLLGDYQPSSGDATGERDSRPPDQG